ncbi:glyoxalase superfamily protein [Pseudooceanicola sp. LIPI14-2-Ac024]|uniref:glyoxalase superfamily protein n=1 Tax=Pseudooceanicola sp. LIPI14-2-Ac024 TaxID=3344875 RepID=UPI0035D0B9B5
MRDITDAKAMAKALRKGLASAGQEISHAQALELVAAQFELPDWNTLAARIAAREGAVRIRPAIPIVRIFDAGKAREFYNDWLGFRTDWEHRFQDGMPLYTQVSRSDCLLHLSEHHGDATPGGTSFVPMEGIEAFHAELKTRPYANMNPGLEKAPWGLEVTVIDPFGNRLRFCEQRGQG